MIEDQTRLSKLQKDQPLSQIADFYKWIDYRTIDIAMGYENFKKFKIYKLKNDINQSNINLSIDTIEDFNTNTKDGCGIYTFKKIND